MFDMFGKQEVDLRAIGCAVAGCQGTRYRLQQGEVLGRTQMPGRLVVERAAECETCHATSQIKIQVKVVRT